MVYFRRFFLSCCKNIIFLFCLKVELFLYLTDNAILKWLVRIIAFLFLESVRLLSSAKLNNVFVVREWLKMWLNPGASTECRVFESMWDTGQGFVVRSFCIALLSVGHVARKCALRLQILLLFSCSSRGQRCLVCTIGKVSYPTNKKSTVLFAIVACIYQYICRKNIAKFLNTNYWVRVEKMTGNN